MTTYVLIPGYWLGAWAWQPVTERLRAAGHTVYPLSPTGLGERAHLGGPDINLETHITDIVNLLRYEDLHDVVLVGHSGEGVALTGAADRVPERLAQLVYVDSAPVPDGTAQIELYPPEGAGLPEVLLAPRNESLRSAVEFVQENAHLPIGPIEIAAAAHLSVIDYLGALDWRGHKQTKDWYAVMKSRPCFRPLLGERMEVIVPPGHYDKVDF